MYANNSWVGQSSCKKERKTPYFKAFILVQTLCTWSSPYNIERESIPIQENKVCIF